MIAAVNLGGDSDTIGAVYGQIAGAYNGFDDIPERWLNAIKDREKANELIDSFFEGGRKIIERTFHHDKTNSGHNDSPADLSCILDRT